MGLLQITPPAPDARVVDVAMLRPHCAGVSDELLDRYQVAAIDYIEGETGACILPQTVLVQLDGFKRVTRSGDILLPVLPVREVSAIEYADEFGVTQTLDPRDYVAEVYGLVARVGHLAPFWPKTRAQSDAVRIRARVGWEPQDMPPGILMAVLMLVACWYRGEQLVGDADGEVGALVNALIHPYRVTWST